MIYIGNHENSPIKLITEINIGDYETGGSGGNPGGGTDPGEDLPGTGTRPERPNAQLPHYRDMVVGNTINWFNKDYLIVDMSDEVAVLAGMWTIPNVGSNSGIMGWYEDIDAQLTSEQKALLWEVNTGTGEPWVGSTRYGFTCSYEQANGGYAWFNSNDHRILNNKPYWTSTRHPNIQGDSYLYYYAVYTDGSIGPSLLYDYREAVSYPSNLRPFICLNIKNYPELPDEASLVLGNTISWANESWVVAHKTTDTCYLVLTHTDGSSPWTNLQVTCNTWINTKLTDRQKTALVEVTAGSTNGIVFVPTQEQINGGFTWFNSSEHRLALDQEYYWTSTEKDINTAICVDDTGVILDAGISKTVPRNFRPAVAIDLTLYDF